MACDVTGSGVVEWVLWAGTLDLEGPLPARFDAAAAAGYHIVSLSPLDVARAAEEGVTAAEIGRRARDAGLRLIVDPVMNWYPVETPSRSRFARFGVDEALRMIGELGAESFTAIASSPDGTTSTDRLVGSFAALCDRAADVGARVHLEFIPMTAIADVATAWAIVDDADRGHAGLVFDTWHFFRGRPDYDALAAVPGERILAVQVDDALAAAGADLWQDTQERLLPGDGDLDLAGALAALARMGALRRVGPEVISPVMTAMDPRVAATLALDRVKALVDGALAGTTSGGSSR